MSGGRRRGPAGRAVPPPAAAEGPEKELLRAEMPSRLEEREALISRALEELRAAGHEPDPFFDRLVLDEALANAILHGNRGDPTRTVRFRLFSVPGGHGFEVEDEGEGFDWKARVEKLKGPPDTTSSTGRGLALIHSLASEVRFLEGGRRIRVIRRPEPQPGGALT